MIVKPLLVLAVALPLVAQNMLAQNSGTCGRPFEATVSPGSQLTMDLRSGDVEVVGTSKPGVRVTCASGNDAETRDVRIAFAAGHLRVYGGPDSAKHFHYRVEVPTATGLLVRCSAGNLTVSGIEGDKEIELKAGNLVVEVGKPESYRVAEASVMAGDLKAPAFGVTKDGLFRDFRKENAGGRYRLKAKVLAGNLTLR